MHIIDRMLFLIRGAEKGMIITMDEKEFKTIEGRCIISEEVIASIAGTAAMEVAGVAGLASRPNDFRGIVSAGTGKKAVKVLNTESETALDIYLDLKQGARIQDVATNVQKSVKAAVQSMTGKPVTRVNVHVSGLVLEEKNA